MSYHSTNTALCTASARAPHLVAHTARDGFCVSGYDVSYTDDIRLSVEQPRGIFMGLMLSGRSTRILLNGIGEFEIPVGRPIIINFCETTQCTNYFKAGEHCAGVGISLPPEFLQSRLNEGIRSSLAPLLNMLDQSTDVEVLDPCPDMGKLADQLVSTTDCNSLMLEGFGFLLLSGFCAKLADSKEQPNFGKLSRLEWQRVKKITDHLDQNLTETPSLGDLSRFAGVNQTTLSDQFKQIHGETIFAYLRNRRLDAARAFLRIESITVTDVSFRVGFASSTSFATAYRRRFGYPPSQETSDT